MNNRTKLVTLTALIALSVTQGCAYYAWEDGYYRSYRAVPYGSYRYDYGWPYYDGYLYGHRPWRPYRPRFDHDHDRPDYHPKPRPRYHGPGSSALPDRRTRPRAQGYDVQRRPYFGFGKSDRD